MLRLTTIAIFAVLIFMCCFFIYERSQETIILGKTKKIIVDSSDAWSIDVNNQNENILFWSFSSVGGAEVSCQRRYDESVGGVDISIVYPSGRAILLDSQGNLHEYDLAVDKSSENRPPNKTKTNQKNK